MDELTRKELIGTGWQIHGVVEDALLRHTATKEAGGASAAWLDKQRLLLADMAIHLLQTGLKPGDIELDKLRNSLHAILTISDQFLPQAQLKHAAEKLWVNAIEPGIAEKMEWEPISEAELRDKIVAAEKRMSPHLLHLWHAIRIKPEKWAEDSYGTLGGGFWVVAIIGSTAIWYNDIEEGFNYSSYTVAGKLAEYYCNQDELEMAVRNILARMETGKESAPRCGAPVPIDNSTPQP
jgi:hypothetical protein